MERWCAIQSRLILLLSYINRQNILISLYIHYYSLWLLLLFKVVIYIFVIIFNKSSHRQWNLKGNHTSSVSHALKTLTSVFSYVGRQSSMLMKESLTVLFLRVDTHQWSRKASILSHTLAAALLLSVGYVLCVKWFDETTSGDWHHMFVAADCPLLILLSWWTALWNRDSRVWYIYTEPDIHVRLIATLS